MNAEAIVHKMYAKDWFSQWLGLQIESIETGQVKLSMTIRKEMLNGFGIAHGGVTFSFADSALAFASNSQGRHAVSIETSISHAESLKEGDEIFAVAKEENLSNKIGLYSIDITKKDGTKVALFKGTVYRTSKVWE